MSVEDVAVGANDDDSPVLEAIASGPCLSEPLAEGPDAVRQHPGVDHLGDAPSHAEVSIAAPARIDVHGKVDALFFDEVPGPAGMAIADGDQTSAGGLDIRSSLAEASSLLAAEYSAEVSQEGDDRGLTADQLVEVYDFVTEVLDRDHGAIFTEVGA